MLGSRSDCILDFYPVMIYLAHKFMIMNTLFPFLSRTHAQMEGVCFYSWTFYIAIDVKTSHQTKMQKRNTNKYD